MTAPWDPADDVVADPPLRPGESEVRRAGAEHEGGADLRDVLPRHRLEALARGASARDPGEEDGPEEQRGEDRGRCVRRQVLVEGQPIELEVVDDAYRDPVGVEHLPV